MTFLDEGDTRRSSCLPKIKQARREALDLQEWTWKVQKIFDPTWLPGVHVYDSSDDSSSDDSNGEEEFLGTAVNHSWEELVFKEDIFWGRLKLSPSMTSEQFRAIQCENNTRIETLVQGLLPVITPQIARLIAEYAHFHEVEDISALEYARIC